MNRLLFVSFLSFVVVLLSGCKSTEPIPGLQFTPVEYSQVPPTDN